MKTLVRIEESLRRHRMVSGGGVVCVAVSGGVDSVVLLHSLVALKKELSIRPVVCHLNHKLRGAESDLDERFVKGLARKLKCTFVVRRLTKKEVEGRDRSLSTQEWARGVRLAFLREAALKKGAVAIATGHNRDDQAETVLMRLIKGTGARGLVGIEPVRRPFIRPLIGISRRDIAAFARSGGIDYVKDSSNRSRKYLRNRLRLDLIPLIEKEYNPAFKEALVRAASALSADEACLSRMGKEALKSAVIRKGGGRGGGRKKGAIVLDRKALLKLDGAVLFRVFQQAALGVGVESGLYSVHFEAFRALLAGKRPNFTVDLPGGLLLGRSYDEVTITKWRLAAARPFKVSLDVPGETVVGGWVVMSKILRKMPKKVPKVAGSAVFSDTAFFDMDRLPGLLVARNFLPGDRMSPLGMKGTKKVKDIFIDAKTAPSERSRRPIVVSDGVVLWVTGLRQSGEFKVTGRTKRVLRLTISGLASSVHSTEPVAV